MLIPRSPPAPPDGYVTTFPGSRLDDFYYALSADPAIVAADEAFKLTATSGERASLNLARDPVYSSVIEVQDFTVGAVPALRPVDPLREPPGTAPPQCADDVPTARQGIRCLRARFLFGPRSDHAVRT
jgi:hypothetical protein